MTKKRIVRYWINIWRIAIVYLAFRLSDEKKIIKMDIQAWDNVKKLEGNEFKKLAMFMLEYKEFRNLFLYRIRESRLSGVLKLLFPPLDTLYLACTDIGGGLFIQHGFSTILAAERVGENCWINQQVTVGYKGNDAPHIGDNVRIHCGALVLGDVTIGNGVIVGAGAVVVKDVPANCTVVGNPARQIRKNDDSCK